MSFPGEAAVQVRACTEGQFLNMRLHSEWLGVQPTQILLTGGGSKSDQICQVAADVFGANVVRMKNAGSASLGAAIMAGVAAGQGTIEQFENSLCQLDDAATVAPQNDSHDQYTALLPQFSDLIQQNL